MNGQLLIENELDLIDLKYPFEKYFACQLRSANDTRKTVSIQINISEEKLGPNYFLVGGPYPNYQPK